MLDIILAILAMWAVLILLSEKKLKLTYALKFFITVFAAAAVLIFVNTVSGFLLTDIFGLAAAVLVVLTVRYACGMKFRKVLLKKPREENKEDGKNRAA